LAYNPFQDSVHKGEASGKPHQFAEV